MGCYLIVTKWRNTNIKSSTVGPVQPRGSGSAGKEDARILESRECIRKRNVAFYGFRVNRVVHFDQTRPQRKQAKLTRECNKSVKFCEQLEQIPRFSG